MFKNKKIKIALLFLAMMALSGCAIQFNLGASGNDGGIWRTKDRGNTWEQKSAVFISKGKNGNFGGWDILNIIVAPQDKKSIYATTNANGLLFSSDGGENWQVLYGLGQETINAVAIDPKVKCIVYAAIANKIFKTTDCNRTWTQIYYGNDVNVPISALAVSAAGNSVVYAGTARGEIIKSLDRGQSWRPVYSFDDRVAQMLISANDANLIFAATANSLHRSNDGGITWVDLSAQVKKVGDFNFRNIILTNQVGRIFLANKNNILRSDDNGDNWSKINLITPAENTAINDLAVNPKNISEIYYVTNTTFYRSLDNGISWAAKKLPTSRAGWKLMMDQENASILYLGARVIKN